MEIELDRVIVEDRVREDLGDIPALMKSIEELGLLQPIGLSRSDRLTFGGRRFEACRRLGWTTIPFVLIRSAEDALLALRGELEENTSRKQLNPVEAQELRRRIRELEAARRAPSVRAVQEDRREPVTGRFGVAEPSTPVEESRTLRAVDQQIARDAGLSLSTLQRVERIQSLQDSPTPVVAEAAKDALDSIRGGAPVKPALDKVLQTQQVSRAVEKWPALEHLAKDPEHVVRMERLLDDVAGAGDTTALAAEIQAIEDIWAPQPASADAAAAALKADQERAFHVNYKLSQALGIWPEDGGTLLGRVAGTLTPTTRRTWISVASSLSEIAQQITDALGDEEGTTTR